MKDRALPALIEAKRHKAGKISRWAERQLDVAGKAIASELVQTEDQQALADILRAYGRIRDPDAARIVISFANSERAQIRLAARQAVAMMGDVATWQLRETYENIVGEKPPREWSWDRTARELFARFDRLRLAQVFKLFDRGLEAQRAGELEKMREHYDKVLAHNPLFDRRAEMADGYLLYARKHADSSKEKAIRALYRGERIAEKKRHDTQVHSKSPVDPRSRRAGGARHPRSGPHATGHRARRPERPCEGSPR